VSGQAALIPLKPAQIERLKGTLLGWLRELVSGRQRGMRAAIWRGLFQVAEVPYAAAVCWRNPPPSDRSAIASTAEHLLLHHRRHRPPKAPATAG
jgi:hypothetical protein